MEVKLQIFGGELKIFPNSLTSRDISIFWINICKIMRKATLIQKYGRWISKSARNSYLRRISRENSRSLTRL